MLAMLCLFTVIALQLLSIDPCQHQGKRSRSAPAVSTRDRSPYPSHVSRPMRNALTARQSSVFLRTRYAVEKIARPLYGNAPFTTCCRPAYLPIRSPPYPRSARLNTS